MAKLCLMVFLQLNKQRIVQKLENRKNKNIFKNNKQNFKRFFIKEQKMINRNIFSQKINEIGNTSKTTKYDLSSNLSPNNKINIRKCSSNQSTVRSPSMTQKQNISSLIKIIPNELTFSSIQQHQLYEIPFFIRNDTLQLQKIRIIPPVKKQFKIKYNQNFNNQIACGLAVKISVLFCSDDYSQRLEDKIIVLGNSFKHQVPLIAESSKPDFQIPKIINIGALVLKQEKRIQIPVKNKGSKAGMISIQQIKTNQYCPNITYTNKSITVVSEKTQIIELFVKPVVLGQLQLKVSFCCMQNCTIKALVVEDQVQILDQNVSKMLLKDFGQLIIGQKLSSVFYIANSTEKPVQCIMKAFNKRKEQAEIKVDKKRNMFISQNSPQQFSQLVQQSCFSVQKQQISINAFESLQNSIQVQKIASKQEVQLFVQNLTKNISSSIYKMQYLSQSNSINSNFKTNDSNQLDNLLTGRSNLLKNGTNVSAKDKIINETLAIKFSHQDKIVKIPLKFLAKIPNLQINTNVFQFNKLFIKETSEMQFILKNLSSKAIKLSFHDSSLAFKQNFKFQGPDQILKSSQQIYKIKFRPLIKKRFSQTVILKVFDNFPIQIKVFGQCLGSDASLIKNQMSLTMTDRNKDLKGKYANWKSLLKDKTIRQQTQQSCLQAINKNLKKINLTQSNSLLLTHQKSIILNRSNKNTERQMQQIAKIVSTNRQQNMTDYKQIKEQLFFKKQDYLKSNKRKAPFNHPWNLREILRYQNLSLQELSKIQIIQKSIQFGHIFIGSKTSKKLTVINRLQNPILFQIDNQGQNALRQNSQQAIRIEGFSTYEIDINLHPTQLGQIQLPLTYIINKQHIFQIKLTAIVTLVNLQLSSRSFVFNFNQDEPIFEKEENLKVFNNGNKKTKFFFQPPENKSFRLSVLEEQLQPKSYMNIKIIYCPFNGEESGQQRVDIQKLKMKVYEGAENIIKCTGTVKQPKILIKETEFNFQNSLISVPITNKISVKNHSKVQTYIKMQFQSVNPSIKKEDIQSWLHLDNNVQPLGPDEKKQIIFNFLCHQAKKIQLIISLSIRGYKIVKIPFSVNLIYPEVATLSPLLNFQDVPIMSNYCIQMISLVNTTQTEIKLQIDNSYPKDQYFIQILAIKQKNLQINYEDQKNKTFLNSFLAAFKDNKRLSKRRSIISNKVLTLPPNCEESVFNIKFVPKCIKKYDFQLPLKLFGCLERCVKPVNLQIKCNAIDPVVYVEPQALKFDTKVICETKSSYSQSIFISNPHNYSVRFRIEPLMRNSQSIPNTKKTNNMALALNQKGKKEKDFVSTMASVQSLQNFSFSNYEGQIEPNARIQIFVIFKPSIQGEFLQKFNIFLGPKGEEVKLQTMGMSSYILDIQGSAILPTLRFNCNEAIMPVVPLNLQSRIFIMIENHGYDAITICKWKTSNHFPHSEVKVNFIEGKLLSLAKKSLRIEVIFSSLAPISFTTMLQFYDEYGNKYQLPLSCTSQNSIFTAYPYLQSDNQHTILFNSDQKLIKIMSTGKNSYYDQNKQLSGNHSMSCLFIQKWINFQLNMNIKSYPQTIVQSQGKQFVKFINRISSKNLIKKHQFVHQSPPEPTEEVQTEISANEALFSNPKGKITKILQIVELYSQTIKKLKAQGAFLNQIRPEFLLNYSQYINYQNHRRQFVCSQSIFDVISVQSWIALFYQLCKIYIQPQITQKIISKMKVQQSLLNSPNITSNLYSSIQLSLLKFVNYYLGHEQGTSQQNSIMVNFTEQIKIFQIIQKILESNFQLSLSQQINSLKNSVSIMSPHVFLSAIAKFLYVQLKQFGLSAYLTTTDLFTMGLKELILYLINLVQMIYHYNNANFIRFEGAVGDKITKVIELQNPTNKKINYFVKIVTNENNQKEKQKQKSSKNNQMQNKSLNLSQSNDNFNQTSFIPEKNQITIDPKQKAELKIVYHCKNAKGQGANLYLIPTKQDDDYTIPQPLLFKLTTSILSKIVLRKINVTSSLYEILPIHLDIELPSQIPQSAEFCLTLFEQTANNEATNNYGNAINPPSFIFNQSHVRTLKQGNKDSLQVKLVPLSLGEKVCKISYASQIYGEFIYQIHAKVTSPKVLKQFRIKDLRVNIDQEVSISISKQNEFLNSIIKVYYPQLYNFHNKTQKNIAALGTKKNISSMTKLNLSLIQKASPRDFKYDIEIMDNQFVSLPKNSNCIQKLDPKQNKIALKAHFTKPFKQYSCILTVKNQLLKDIRLYRIIFIVTSPPKIIKMSFKAPARQSITQKIPIKNTPCDVSLSTNCQCFVVQNLSKEYFANTELICHFNPSWTLEKQAVIQVQNKQTLEQIIYQISLKGQQPQKFGTFQLIASSLFNQQVSIPIDIASIFNQYQDQNKLVGSNNSSVHSNHNKKGICLQIKRLFKRPHAIQCQQFYPFLNSKPVKSNTGLYVKGNNSLNLLKESAQKMKIAKTKSMVEQKIEKNINLILYSSPIENQSGSIRLCKPNSEEYYWAKVIIKNRPVIKLKHVKMQQKINLQKIQYLDDFMISEEIDFEAADFEFKFQKESNQLKFAIQQTQKLPSSVKSTSRHSGIKIKKPMLIFHPSKEIEVQRKLFFRCNNKQYMLPISLKADPMPTIIVPQITTCNVDLKNTYVNLINGTQHPGDYHTVILNNEDPKNRSFKFSAELNQLQQDTETSELKNKKLSYNLNPKEKKQIKICFKPKYINQKEKFMIKFESDTLPNYTYILNGRSQFKVEEEYAQFQIYEDNLKPFVVQFTNLFQRKQYFTVELEQFQEKQTCLKIEQIIKVQDPINKKINLEQNDTKCILISVKQSYFAQSHSKCQSQQKNGSQNLKVKINIKMGQKIVKKFIINLLIIKNLFSLYEIKSDEDKTEIQQKDKFIQKSLKQKFQKKKQLKNKNNFNWFCKARQTIYETIQLPSQLNLTVKDIKCPQEVSKYLSFTCICQNQQSVKNFSRNQINHLKIKYSPLKPLKKKKYDLILIGEKNQKYRIQCQIFVDQPAVDDNIVIKTTEIDQIGCVSFKLTNTTKSSAKYKAYFSKKMPQFSLDTDHGVLEGYGKPGTLIVVRFKSHINNRRLQEKLIIETQDMYWCFKVKGMLSKDNHN